MKRLLIVGISGALALALLSLAGCGDDNQGSGGSGGAAGTGVSAGLIGSDNCARGVSSCGQPLPAVGMTVGGSNYGIITAGTYKTTCQDWQTQVKAVVAYYHQYPSTVRSQLQAMYSAGQRRIVLPLWHARLGALGPVYMHVVQSDGGSLVPQHAQNLRDLIYDLKWTGFEEMVFRFNVQGSNVPVEPSAWPAWNEDLYQENWNFIVNVRRIVNQAWCGDQATCGGAGLLYDLGGELGGLRGPLDPYGNTYQQRLWRNYVVDAGFGKVDSFGFSVAGGYFDRVRALETMYDASIAGRPYLYAFDLYDDAGSQLASAHAALSSHPGAGFIILESYYNDATERDELRAAIQSTGRPIFWLAQ